jgi:hypothetical protein
MGCLTDQTVTEPGAVEQQKSTECVWPKAGFTTAFRLANVMKACIINIYILI